MCLPNTSQFTQKRLSHHINITSHQIMIATHRHMQDIMRHVKTTAAPIMFVPFAHHALQPQGTSPLLNTCKYHNTLQRASHTPAWLWWWSWWSWWCLPWCAWRGGLMGGWGPSLGSDSQAFRIHCTHWVWCCGHIQGTNKVSFMPNYVPSRARGSEPNTGLRLDGPHGDVAYVVNL